jgi:hypothetical protein
MDNRLLVKRCSKCGRVSWTLELHTLTGSPVAIAPTAPRQERSCGDLERPTRFRIRTVKAGRLLTGGFPRSRLRMTEAA